MYLSYSWFCLQVLTPGFHIMDFWIHVTKNGEDSLDKKLGHSPKTRYYMPFSLDLCTHQNSQSQRCATDIISAENSYSRTGFIVSADSHLFQQAKNNFIFCFMNWSKIDSSLRFPKTACLETRSWASFSCDIAGSQQCSLSATTVSINFLTSTLALSFPKYSQSNSNQSRDYRNWTGLTHIPFNWSRWCEKEHCYKRTYTDASFYCKLYVFPN